MQSKDPFIGRYPASDHQDLIQVVGPGGGVQWRLSQASAIWFSGSGSPTTSAFPGALANNLYYDTLSGNVWQFDGTAWALLVTAPSGSYISFEDDFTNQAGLVFGETETNYPGDQNWLCISTAASSYITLPADGLSSIQNPGVIQMGVGVEGGQGASLYRGNGQGFGDQSPLGALNSYSGWQMDCWFAPYFGVVGGPLPGAVRVGFCVGGQAIADAPTGGAWVEYDTSNPNSSSGFVLRTVDNSTSTYIPLGYTPPGSPVFRGDRKLPWNHVTLLSPAPGVIVCRLVVQNSIFNGGAEIFNASVTSTLNTQTNDSYTPMMQVFDRGGEEGGCILIDRFSYSAPTGRI